MAAVQFLLLVRLRVGKGLVFVLLAGIFLLVGLQFFSEGLAGADRLISINDTRGHVWQRLIQEFLRYPLMGAMGEEFVGGESSYLSVASQMGLFGLVPFSIALALAGVALFRLHRLRGYFGEYVLLADLVTSGLAALAVGGIFEAYLLGTLSVAIFFLYAYMMLLAFLLDVGSAQREIAAYDDFQDPSLEAKVAYESGY
jgi:hypothetical protein